MSEREAACIAACEGISTEDLESGILTTVIEAARAIFTDFYKEEAGIGIWDRIMPVYDALNRLPVLCRSCHKEPLGGSLYSDGKCTECTDKLGATT